MNLTDPCPAGWVAGYHKCYLFTGLSMDYSSAVTYCEGLSGVTVLGQVRYPSLMVMENATERDVFVGLEELQENAYWVNCNDIEEEGTWICVADRFGTLVDYTGKSRSLTCPEASIGEGGTVAPPPHPHENIWVANISFAPHNNFDNLKTL